ncbi:adenylate-forming reductase 06235 [Ricinus communis]|uniref:Integral membrane protein TmpA n=1 Tax=Ricinus communis TaxID=3988 RepID=B9S979_RICCO|nr:adenylate-forming reductase 06235 [Ricinus communis]EEF39848.1 conserved hypothetical protein [Ricinus communis]|eukprot:XP_002522548.1 adenylate-forming reductase 06235 [Ricinus communis]
MERMPERAVGKSTSCRGVAFERTSGELGLLPKAPPALPQDGQSGRWVWIPRSQKVFFQDFLLDNLVLERTVSRSSSHFCDLDFTDEGAVKDHFQELMEKGEICHDDHLENQNIADIEKQMGQAPKPAAKPRKPSRLSIILLDQGLFTVYKRLFMVCLILNIIALVLAAMGHFPYAKYNAALFAIGNILALSLCRSEAFLRVVFLLVVKLFGRKWVPLHFKTAVTSFLQSLGGIHSSCGVSSIAWLVYALVLSIKDKQNTPPEIIAVASTILSLICISSLAAFPLVRHLHHNVFERTHRFTGWTALALLWVFVVLTISYNPNTKTYNNFFRSNFYNKQEFWFTLSITITIIIPWLTVSRVPVKVSSTSNHASIIKFEGGVKAGLLGRISPSPLSEWHAFGIISSGEKDHMMLAGAVGDFTKSLVSNPPTYLWVRKLHFAGLPYLINLYKKVMVVATGSGICVFLSFLLQPCSAEVCLVWVAKGIDENFGKEIMDIVSGYPKDKVIMHDTAILGRPNVAKMSVEAAKNWGAEVVIVTSNPEGSRDVVNACKASGIPAFGPIWDS